MSDTNSETASELINIQSTGDVQVSSNNQTTVEGGTTLNLVTGDASNGQIKINTAGDISLIAKNSIKLIVGNNAISITHDGIAISAGGSYSTSGPMSSVLSLNSYSGIAASGTKCAFNGTLGTNIMDGMGNSISLGPSGLALTGLSLILKEASKNAAITTAILTGVKLLSQIATSIAYSCSGDSTANNINKQITQILKLVGPTMGLKQKISEYNLQKADAKPADKCALATQVLNFIALLLNVTASSVNTWDPEWAGQYVGDSTTTTNMDCFRICAQICSFAACVVTLIPTLSAMEKKDLTSVRMKKAKLEIKAKDLKSVTVTTNANNSQNAAASGAQQQGTQVKEQTKSYELSENGLEEKKAVQQQQQQQQPQKKKKK